MTRRGPLERDTCRDSVLPMLRAAGWRDDMIVAEYQVRADRVLRAGSDVRDLGNGRVDYVLEAQPGVPVAVVEAKREYLRATDGLQQAIRYAQQLRVPRAYATNGREIIERDLTTGRERMVTASPPPADLWSAYLVAKGLSDEAGELLGFGTNRRRRTAGGEVVEPRWYQTAATQEVLAAIARGDRRVLLLMATGTGKTFTAMQIVHKLRLWQATTDPRRNYRVLFLADLDVLLTQPMDKAFAPAFGVEPLRRIKGRADLNRELYFASYQALSGSRGEDESELFESYPADFFDLVIVDECHRGSAAADSSWRRILDHFTSAVHLGLTATPKQADGVDTLSYFGEPVFTYTLRQGVEDGYLAPYRVRRVVLSPDAEGWMPDPGQIDRLGREIPDGVYTTRDFERVVSLLARTDLAARHLTDLLARDPGARAMVFCHDQAHAEDMRAALTRHNPDAMRTDPEWVVRIVGAEPERVRLLEAFCDPDRSSPVVATTSRLLSTGVDVEDLKYVVLFRGVGSMVEFKQIIGRGTRLFPAKGKDSFEIVDYVGATRHFEDPAFDGYPAHALTEYVDDEGRVVDSEVDDAKPTGEATSATAEHTEGSAAEATDRSALQRRAFVVDDGDFSVVVEAVHVVDTSTGGMRLTEYGAFVAQSVRALADDPDDLADRWADVEQRTALLERLRSSQIEVDTLIDDPRVDLLDRLVHLAWNRPAPTRAERARKVRERHRADLEARSAAARAVLEGLLERYTEHGIDDVASGEVLRLPPLVDIGSPAEIAVVFGGAQGYHASVDQLQRWLYERSDSA